MPPWKPGQSGNPRGRTPGRSVSERYRHFLEQPLHEHTRRKLGMEKGATLGDALALQQVRQGMRGNTNAAREVREAIEGKAPQRIELTGSAGGPVALSLNVDASLKNLHEITERLRVKLSQRTRKK